MIKTKPTATTATIQAEFDRIALVTSAEGWSQNSYYHDFLLRHTPAGCRKALEIGCGTGAFSRRLAARSEHVTALDLSPEMIRIARERSAEFPNIEFHVQDAASSDFPSEEFDCIATIATLHHLPFKLMLDKMKRALRVGGVLLILDLLEPESFYDLLTSAVAYPVCASLRLLKQRRLRPPAEVRAAWAEHEQYDSYLTLSEVRAACNEALPGARVRRHLMWRYSVVWKKVVV
ncbi:MAG: methyltransferase domain-containing protein [Pyrinomonadaceae bacterium]|nr:methyltransferase domain-containing protein [Pyrinomonadaceae bacterium]